MISIIGIGNGAASLVQRFKEYPQYNIYCLHSKADSSSEHYSFKLKEYENPEEYEKKYSNPKEVF
jgi:hypothetical protein